MNFLLGAISLGGGGMINQLVTFLMFGLCLAIVWGMGFYFFKKLPPMVMFAWNGLFVLLGGLVIINFLLGPGGKDFIKW